MIDIGCGSGIVTYDVAVHSKPSLIMGVDMDKKLYGSKVENLKFMVGKAPDDIPDEYFDVVILSNVLEHQQNRIKFLKETIRRVKQKILIRVTCFERGWRVPLKKLKNRKTT